MFAKLFRRETTAEIAASHLDDDKIAAAIIACSALPEGAKVRAWKVEAPAPAPKVHIPPHMRHLMIPVEEKLAVYSQQAERPVEVREHPMWSGVNVVRLAA